MSTDASLTLHTYFRSSCSARVRTALYHKNLSFTSVPIHLLKSEQTSPAYTALNPSCSVPTLTVSTADNRTLVINQSISILEYLEEAYPPPEYPSLLPKDAGDRAFVRDLACILACDTQPVANLRVLNEVEMIAGKDASVAWCKKFMERGLKAYEAKLARLPEHKTGRYSFGDGVTMADVCLAPAVEAALRFGCDLREIKRIVEIYEALSKLDSFLKGDWRHQEDTPEQFRA
ncbi:hypothetical protein RUND412_009986 [Rhizina undulata]